MKQQSIKVELTNGRERVIDLADITEYGREARLVTVPAMPLGYEWPTYRSGRPFCYVKVRPFNEMFIITDQSLADVHEAMTGREER